MKAFCSDLDKEEVMHGLAKSNRLFARGSTNGVKSSPPLDRIQHVQLLWTDTCKEVKHHYSKLSSALMLLTGRALTPISSSSSPSPATPHHSSKSTSLEQHGRELASLNLTGSSEHGAQLDDESLDNLLSSLQQEVNQQVKSLEQYLDNTDNLSSSKLTQSLSASKSVPAISFSTEISPGQKSKSMSRQRATSHKMLGSSLSSTPQVSQQNTNADSAIQELDDFISSLALPAKQVTSNYRSRSATSGKANCRLARKLREISPKLRGAEKSLGEDAACPLQVAALEARLTDYKVSQLLFRVSFCGVELVQQFSSIMERSCCDFSIFVHWSWYLSESKMKRNITYIYYVVEFLIGRNFPSSPDMQVHIYIGQQCVNCSWVLWNIQLSWLFENIISSKLMLRQFFLSTHCLLS